MVEVKHKIFVKDESCFKTVSETLPLIKSPETASQVSGQKVTIFTDWAIGGNGKGMLKSSSNLNGWATYEDLNNPGQFLIADELEFTLTVEAEVANSTGQFKTIVYVIPPIPNGNGSFPDEEAYPIGNTSCCRMAAEKGINPELILDSEIKFEALHIFPNPSNQNVNIDWNGEEAQLEVWDGLGRMVSKNSISEGKSTLNTERLASGIYHIRVKGKEKIHNIKLQLIK